MNELRRHWLLEEGTVFLNHGSFGACPRPVLAAQAELRERMEREPVRFFTRELPALRDAAREVLARFVGAAPEGLAFVPNATTALNSVLRSFPFEPGDEVVVTDHEYNATRNAAEFAAARRGARAVVAAVPFPLPPGPAEASDAVVDAVLAACGPRTRLAVIDHVTSQTALVLPVERLVPALRARGVAVLVDGAHAPGMLPLSLDALGADYYTGNCHKWLCAPKGSGFLHVRRERRAEVRPAVISHGANARVPDASARFRVEFDWTGSDDPTPALCVPDALRFLASLDPGGVPALAARGRALAREARRSVASALGVPLPCPDEALGSMASLPLPADLYPSPPAALGAFAFDPVHDALFHAGLEVPVLVCPAFPGRLLRLSAAPYNDPSDYHHLVSALLKLRGRS